MAVAERARNPAVPGPFWLVVPLGSPTSDSCTSSEPRAARSEPCRRKAVSGRRAQADPPRDHTPARPAGLVQQAAAVLAVPGHQLLAPGPAVRQAQIADPRAAGLLPGRTDHPARASPV